MSTIKAMFRASPLTTTFTKKATSIRRSELNWKNSGLILYGASSSGP